MQGSKHKRHTRHDHASPVLSVGIVHVTSTRYTPSILTPLVVLQIVSWRSATLQRHARFGSVVNQPD